MLQQSVSVAANNLATRESITYDATSLPANSAAVINTSPPLSEINLSALVTGHGSSSATTYMGVGVVVELEDIGECMLAIRSSVSTGALQPYVFIIEGSELPTTFDTDAIVTPLHASMSLAAIDVKDTVLIDSTPKTTDNRVWAGIVWVAMFKPDGRDYFMDVNMSQVIRSPTFHQPFK